MPGLRKTMPTRDPKRADREPQHSREYSASRGGWTRKTAEPDKAPKRRR